MKHICTTLILLFSFILISCSKNEYIEEVVIPNKTIIVNIAPTSWKTNNAGVSYVANINMPEISSQFNERGGVLVYLTFGNATYEQLPEVYNGVSYSFTSSPGTIELELQDSNGQSVIKPPLQTITAKIILVESQF